MIKSTAPPPITNMMGEAGELFGGPDVVEVGTCAEVVVVVVAVVVGIVDVGKLVVIDEILPSKAYVVKLEIVVETVLKEVLTSEVNLTQADPFH